MEKERSTLSGDRGNRSPALDSKHPVVEEQLRILLEMSKEGILILNGSHRVESANRMASEITGYSPGEIQGLDFLSLFPDEEKEVLRRELKLPLKVMIDRYCSDHKIICSDGTLKEMEISIASTKDRINQPKTYVYLHNISRGKTIEKEAKEANLELKKITKMSEQGIQMENRLRKANEFLENVIKSSVDGIIAADMKGNIIIFNEGAERLLGYQSEEVIGKIHITKLYRPGVAEETMKKLRSEQHGPKGKLETTQTIIVGKGGEEIPVNISAAIIYEGDQEIATVGIFTDLRERLRMQHQLEQTHLRLVQSEKLASLGKLAAGVAHEINNPLGGIMMYANMLLDSLEAEDPKAEDLKLIVEQTLRCKGIVKELLEFAHQTTQKKTMGDLNRSLQQAVSLLENQATFHNIEIIKRFDKNLPQVIADFSQLNQVFINLVINAADAMGGKGTLEIQTQALPDGDTVEVKFSDTGCGIPKENLSRIFDPFFTTKAVGKGTGLGLSMSYGIIQKHGGTIDVYSEKGKETTFTIHLPIGARHREKPHEKIVMEGP